jgi:hypothetical protein
VIKPKTTRWRDYVALMGQTKCTQGFGCGKLKEKCHLPDLSVDGEDIKICKLHKMGGLDWIIVT